MFPRNIRRWALSTAMLMALSVAMLGNDACVAQTAPADTALPRELPDPSRLAEAFAVVRTRIGSAEQDQDSAFSIPGATTVCVILRHNGRVLGVGEDSRGDDLMLHRAAVIAIRKMRDDPAMAAMSADVQPLIGASLCIEIEAGGKWSPLVGRTIPQMSTKLEPGMDGAALRRNDKTLALFPSQLRATNTADDLNGRLLGLAMKSGLQAGDLRDLSKIHDTSFYRFRTVHLVQTAADAAPMQTYRGDQLVRGDTINRQSIQSLADGLVSHLRASMWPDPPPLSAPGAVADHDPPLRKPLGLMGDYRIVADDYRPMIANPLEQALAAFALLQYSKVPGANPATAPIAETLGTRILSDLAFISDGETDPANDLAACAAIVYAVSQNPSMASDPAIELLFSRAADHIVTSFDPQKSSFIADGNAQHPVEVQTHTMAMAAGAMCRLLTMRHIDRVQRLSLDPKIIRAAVDRAWNSVFEPQRIALLPWIGWAEVDWSIAQSQAMSRAEDLRKLAAALDKAWIGPDAVERPLDLCGGFEFTTDDGTLRPDSQSARPAAWIGSALLDDRIIPAEQQETAMARHLLTMRFLIQLTVREPERYSLRNPTAALGGIRTSPGNSQQPVAAQAMALLAAAETLRSLERPTVRQIAP